MSYCACLFREPERVIAEYGEEKVEQGLQFVSGYCGFLEGVFDRGVHHLQRRECVLAMRELYARAFSSGRMRTISYMWWDKVLASGAFDGNSMEGDSEVRGAVLQVLREVVAMASPQCQIGALHGLEEIPSIAPSEVYRIVTEFLDLKLPADADVNHAATRCMEAIRRSVGVQGSPPYAGR
jgi:hypothetical protein